jgi:tetratricopeptide (TPR) repeat protein
MPNDDWFRSCSWDEASKTLFWQKLGRSRGAHSKGQYVRIKALSLQETKEPAKIRAAISLLDYFLAEWPDHFDTSSVLNQLAQCAFVEGRVDDALRHYIEVFDSQRKRPNMRTQAHLDFGWLVICRPVPSHYEQALSILDEFHGVTPFPVDVYRASTIRAVILSRLDREPQRAAELAATALAAARMTQAPLRYHPKLGLVKHVDDDIRRELEALL